MTSDVGVGSGLGNLNIAYIQVGSGQNMVLPL